MEPKVLTFQLLEEITNDFSEERKLGRGAYGSVYKGVYKDGEQIAVKMIHDQLGLDDKQFQNEFENLMRLKHPNIVGLVGYCYETQRKHIEYNGKLVFAERTYQALCFEYMQNGSLRKHLFAECDGPDWHTRYKIIKGICEGLLYLHEGLKNPIYHLDLKPDNILLDNKMVPKLADFGLSKLFGEEQTRMTQSAIGTIRYLPPEYIERNVVSIKLDIFSLGVVIIELMTGPKGYSRCAEMSSEHFVDLVHANWRKRLQEQSSLESLELYCEQVKRCIEVALNCVEIDRNKRPYMRDIIHQLNETETMIQNMLPCSNEDILLDQAENLNSSHGRNDQGRIFPPLNNTMKDLSLGCSDAVVLYTTSLGYIPETVNNCEKVRLAIKSLGVKYIEKNFHKDRSYVQELMRLLRTSYVSVPALFIRGKHIGGMTEVLKLQEQGRLATLLEGLPKVDP